MGKNPDIDCRFAEEKEIFKSRRIAEPFKHRAVSGHFLCILPEREESFSAPCLYPVFKNRNNFCRLHKPGSGLSGLPPKAAVTALVSADIGYRDENVF
jgi:hypothetical protein